MTMMQVGAIGVIGVLFALQLQQAKREFAIYIGVAISLLLFLAVVDKLKQLVDFVSRIMGLLPIEEIYFTTLLKMAGITYLAEFSSAICKDSGFASLGNQIELFGKISILLLALPIVQALLQTIEGFLG